METKTSYSKTICAKTYLFSMLVPQIMGIICMAIISLFFNNEAEMKQSFFYIIPMMIIAQIAFLLIYFYVHKKNNINALKASKIKFKLKPLNVFLCIVISVVAIVGLTNFVGLFNEIFIKMGYSEPQQLLPCTNFGFFIINVLTSALLPAIAEELIFRGIIFNGLKKNGVVFATIISSVMFMLVHLNICSLIYPLIMGAVFAFVVHATGSVVYSMIIHFSNNFLVLLIQYLNNVTGANFLMVNLNSGFKVFFVILLAITSILIIVLIVQYLIKTNKTKEDLATKEINCQNEIMQIQEKQENVKLYSALLVGMAFWLLVIILGFI